MLGSCAFIFILLSITTDVRGDLAITGKHCGTKICSLQEFCSNFNKQCESCSTICEETSHNFDRNVCMDGCQDYLHDLRYARASRYEDDIQKLKRQQEITTILLIVLLALFVITYSVNIFRWLRRKDYISAGWILQKIKLKKKPTLDPVDLTHQNPHTESPKGKRRVVDEPDRGNSNVFSVSGVDGSTIHTVSTPVSTRYPAENNTTEYSYDNAALQVTPVSEKPRGTETTF